MKNSNWAGLAVLAVILLVLALMAVHLDPALASVIGAILVGVAAIISAINRHPDEPATGYQEADGAGDHHDDAGDDTVDDYDADALQNE